MSFTNRLGTAVAGYFGLLEINDTNFSILISSSHDLVRISTNRASKTLEP